MTDAPWTVVPEGGDDASLETPSGVIELQIKSRQPHLGLFPIIDLADWLAELDEKHDDDRTLGVLVERDVKDVSPTGFNQSLRLQSPERLIQELIKRHKYTETSAGELLSRSHLIVLESPVDSAARKLAAEKTLPPSVARILVRQIQELVGQMADQQSAPDAPPVTGLSKGDVAALCDRTLESIDLDALEGPVRTGLVEHVDFAQVVADENFYLGVDVVPGHVAAGLVIQRPEDVANVLARLQEERIALITGQSGAGKSALGWLAAFSSRATMSWVRVRQIATASDVPTLIRYAETLQASPNAPVGFVVDNLTGEMADVWDVLASEIVYRPELYLLGTVREEDVPTLTRAPLSSRVGIHLNSRLAKDIFEQLQTRGQLSVSAWKESFQDSKGLLLEYVHLLTTGTRLPSLIREQVDRRRTERRDLELSILRIASLAAAAGGLTSTGALQSELGATAGDMQRGLSRILEEHLIREFDGGYLGGLHEVRSRAIIEATHVVPPPTVAETARSSIACVRASDLVSVLGSLVYEGHLQQEDAQEELRKRLSTSPDLLTLEISLNALRHLSVMERARRLSEIALKHQVSPAFQELAVQFAAIGATELDAFASELRSAVPEMITVVVDDYRIAFLERLDEAILRDILDGGHEEDVVSIFEAFDGLGDAAPIDALAALGTRVPMENLQHLAEVLVAARGVSDTLAMRLVEAWGGENEIEHRANSELPWVQSLALISADGIETVEADWLFIGASTQENPHERVVELCHTLAGLFPHVGMVSVTAIDPSGEPAGIGDVLIAKKNIPRSNLTTPQQIRWHRTLIGTYMSLAGLPSKTARLQEEAEIVRATQRCAEEVVTRWIAGSVPTDAQVDEINEITRRALQVAKQPTIPDDPLERAIDPPDVGDAASACKTLIRNALPRLFEDENWNLASFLHDTVRSGFSRISGIGYWTLLESDLDREINALTEMVQRLNAVLSGKLIPEIRDGNLLRTMRTGGGRALEKAAEFSIREGARLIGERARKLESSLAELGVKTSVEFTPALKSSGLEWPALDVWVLLHLDSVFDFVGDVEAIVDVVERAFESTRRITVIPAREGLLIGPLAMHGRRFQGLVLPSERPDVGWPSLEGGDWADLALHLDLEKLVDGALRLVTLEALSEKRELVAEENLALEEANQDISSAAQSLVDTANSDETGFLSTILQPIADFVNSPDFSARMARYLRDEDDEIKGLLGTARLALLEWDINSETAADLTERFLDQFNEEDGADS
jgi:hypothetical protein